MKTIGKLLSLLFDWLVFACGLTMIIERIASWQVFVGIILVLITLPSVLANTIQLTKKSIKQSENKEV